MYKLFEDECERVVKDDNSFTTFRLNKELKTIVEGINIMHGREYLNDIKKNFPNALLFSDKILEMDLIGSPSIPKELKISPLFARYIHQTELLKKYFNTTPFDKLNILEIGAGFGGHACVLNSKITTAGYNIVDLPSVGKLIQKYILAAGFSDKIKVFSNINNDWKSQSYDLIISHYCFSEIDSNNQDYYLNVIKNTPRGFMICNIINKKSHHKNNIVKWIHDAHPSLKIYDEIPCTYRGNYILVWNDCKN